MPDKGSILKDGKLKLGVEISVDQLMSKARKRLNCTKGKEVGRIRTVVVLYMCII